MKKIMIICTVITIAACAQAAAVSWSTGKIKQANTDGSFSSSNLTSSWATYAVEVTFYADNEGVMGNALTGITGTTDTTVSLGNFSASTSDSFSAETKYWAKIVIQATKADSTVYTMTSDAISFTTQATGDTSVSFASALPSAWATASSDDPTGDVPEPTSGLLLVLGAAGLALRRRRA